MKYQGTIIAGASGKLGGLVFAHNRAGDYIRKKSMPVQPASNPQEVIRAIINDLSSRWVTNLTTAQRTGWEQYAQNTLQLFQGGTQLVTGLNMYVRANTPRMQAGLIRVDNAPTIYDVGSFSPPIYLVTAPSTHQLVIQNTDDWANEDDAAMLIFMSIPKNPTINFFKGPYRSVLGIAGDATTPPTSPSPIGNRGPIVAGNKSFIRVAVTRADGRYSFSQRIAAIAS